MTAIPVYQWQPTTSVVAARAGIDPSEVVRFDHNTSVASPPWAPEAAADALRLIQEYPEADYTGIRTVVADYHGVDPDMVVPGAGADELISLCAQAFLRPGDLAVADSPTYPLYRIVTLRRGADYHEVPRARDLALAADDLGSAAEGAHLTWLCIPCNPIGDRPAPASVDHVVASAGGVVVVDAAYAEYAGDRWAAAIEGNERLIVLGTFSKAFGLAGIRVGYALATREHAAALEATRPPGSISSVSAAIAQRAMGDLDWMRRNVRRTLDGRIDLDMKLRALPVTPLPSATNFLLARFGPHAPETADRLLDRGLVVRSFAAGHPLAEYLRFTVRTPPDHDRLAATLEEVLP